MPKPDVGGDDADERHARKIVPLRDHLRADEHVDLAVAKLRQQRRSSDPFRRIASRSSRATRAPGTCRFTSASTRSVPKPGLFEVGRRTQRTRWRARAPCSCSSDSGPAAPLPRRGRPATRCSSDSRPCRRTGGRTRPSRSRAGSAARSTAPAARGAARCASRKRATQDDVRTLGRVLLAHVDDRHRGQRTIHARGARQHDVLVLAGRSRCDSVSIDGVADPSTTSAPARCARTIATSRPL